VGYDVEGILRGPDGEIGRHSGLKIVEVYGFIADKSKITKDL
jgi:hypothetical protein